MAVERVAVLLGAGASVDADLPMTGGLTKALIRSIKEEFEIQRPELVEAFNFVCSAMIGHRGNAGVDPYSALNVERVFSAIRLLRNRADHEAAPFVSAWLPSVESFDNHPVPSSHQYIVNQAGFVDTATIAKIARAAMKPGDGEIYRELDAALKTQVCKLLARHKEVDYLKPLADLALKQGGLTVATLNYDLTVEAMCREADVDVDTGILNWTPGKALTFSQGPKGSLNLIKLHGSINWTSNAKIPGMDDTSRFIRTLTLTETEPSDNHQPAIVIGDREKLTADGPTLALMHSFEEGLLKAKRLVVIGYSFGDDHINSVIRNWINARSERTLTVLDPYWSWDATGFQKDLINGLTDSPLGGPTGKPRMNVITKKTREGLAEALRLRPKAAPPTQLRATFLLDQYGNPMIRITNTGPEITQLKISAVRNQPDGRTEIIRGFIRPRSGSGAYSKHTYELHDLDKGGQVDVEPVFLPQAEHGRTVVDLEYLTHSGRRSARLEVQVTSAEIIKAAAPG